MYISSRSEKYFAKSVKSTTRSPKQQSTVFFPSTIIHIKFAAPQKFAQRGSIIAFNRLPSALRKNLHGLPRLVNQARPAPTTTSR